MKFLTGISIGCLLGYILRPYLQVLWKIFENALTATIVDRLKMKKEQK